MIALGLLARFRAASAPQRAEKTQALLARPALRDLCGRAIALAPDAVALARNAGMMFVNRGAPAEALPLLERAQAWIDDDVDTLIALATVHRALGQTDAAVKWFATARRLELRRPALPSAR